MTKRVRFSGIDTIYETYPGSVNSADLFGIYYDRSMIDHLMYRKVYNRVSKEEFATIFYELDMYKKHEMLVHKDSINNISFKML